MAIRVTSEVEGAPTGMFFISERRPKRSLSLFFDRTRSGKKGLLIVRNQPEGVSSDDELERIECHRLLLRETENSIRPSDLKGIEEIITSFFARSRGGIALLEGFEMLTMFNDFDKVTVMLNKAQSAADSSGGFIVIPIDNRAIYPEDLRRISENYKFLGANRDEKS